MAVVSNLQVAADQNSLSINELESNLTQCISLLTLYRDVPRFKLI